MGSSHRAGFVSIVGKPNVGKSTLMNALVGDNLSIITSKVQTTRHRIQGILSGEDFQIVYSDTPGFLTPHSELHKAMMRYIAVSLEDADLVLMVVDPFEKYDRDMAPHVDRIKVPIILVINKMDLIGGDQLSEKAMYWKECLQPDAIVPTSGLKKKNIDLLLDALLVRLPCHPAYYAKDELTNRSERFFAAEIVREKIFLFYSQEIPYSVEVVIEEFREEGNLLRVRAHIFVERDSQKGIIIGRRGEALKRVGTAARKEMEAFFRKKVFLEMRVKVAENWRKSKSALKQFGYIK